MRHQKKRHKLGRTAPHRKATMVALSSALIRHKRITTTIPKAKALRVFIEPLITRAKADTTHNRRQVFRKLQDNASVTELFTEISGQVGDRPGGYTRIVKLGRRAGDGAAMAMIELVDYNDIQPDGTSSGSKRTRRGSGRGRRGGRSRRGDAEQTAATAGAAADSTAETPDPATADDTDVPASVEVAEDPDARGESGGASADSTDTAAAEAADKEKNTDQSVSTENEASDETDLAEEAAEPQAEPTEVSSEPADEAARADNASEADASDSVDEAAIDEDRGSPADAEEDAPEASSASDEGDEKEGKK